jgi:hypothetical protein
MGAQDIFPVTYMVFSGLNMVREIGVQTFMLWESITDRFFGTRSGYGSSGSGSFDAGQVEEQSHHCGI